MRRKRNKLYLSELYKKWVNNIIKELKNNQTDRALLLNGCGWYPTTQENDKILQNYYWFQYLLRKINYYLYIEKKFLSEPKLVEKEDIFEFFQLLKSYGITTPTIIKYREKLKLHYPEFK